jgi:transcriptional regulator with XRE-family HTH domain
LARTLPQDQVAEEAGLSVRTRIENGQSTETARRLRKLRVALERFGIEFFFEGDRPVGDRKARCKCSLGD